MEETLRAFVAIELPERTKEELGRLRRELAPRLPGFRWVRPEALHLTLRFLGNVAPGRFAEAGALLERGIEAGGPLTLVPRGLGAFPDARRPRVLWAGLSGDTARLARLAVHLTVELERLGFPPEVKPFRAHLTLARAERSAPPGAVSRAVEAFADWQGAPFAAGELILYQSILESGGARHLPRHRGLLL